MNKKYYSFGNPFKVKFRKHYCHKCGVKLDTTVHRKVVDKKSEEAKYYDFSANSNSVMIGPCEFTHRLFYCPNCLERIEFVTQLSLEDVDILIKKVEQRYLKKGINLEIKKTYETKEETLIDKVDSFDDIKYLCLTGYKDNRELFMCKFPLLRKNIWERPYYFNITAKKLVKSIKEQLK